MSYEKEYLGVPKEINLKVGDKRDKTIIKIGMEKHILEDKINNSKH